MAYNLMNEPRCNCAPTVVNSATGYASQDTTDCANINDCFTAVQVRDLLSVFEFVSSWQARRSAAQL